MAGAEIVIQADGKVKGQGSLKAVADSDKKSKIPYVEMKMGETSAAIGLLKIGFKIRMETSLIPASHV